MSGGEDEVDDYAGGDVDGDPGDAVLTWEVGWDLAEIFGTCYDLEDGHFMSARDGSITDYHVYAFSWPPLLAHRTKNLRSEAIPACSTFPLSSPPVLQAGPLGR